MNYETPQIGSNVLVINADGKDKKDQERSGGFSGTVSSHTPSGRHPDFETSEVVLIETSERERVHLGRHEGIYPFWQLLIKDPNDTLCYWGYGPLFRVQGTH
jgi:hypothetical protein